MKNSDRNKILLRIGALLLAAIIVFGLLSHPTYAQSAEPDNTFTDPPDYESNFYLPSNMRGVFIRPESEFITGEADEINQFTVQAQLDETLDRVVKFGLNSVIIATSTEDRIYYSADTNKTDAPDYISMAVDSARTRGLNVYLVFDINTVLCGLYENKDRAVINALITEVHKFTLKYVSDGIILDNYYNSRSSESFCRYMEGGSGIGYVNWLYGSTENFLKTAADVVHMTDNSIPVGIMLRDVWANYDEEAGEINDRGSETQSEFEALYDGYADTLAFVEGRYADFAVADAPDALTDGVGIPFDKITDYWGAVCESARLPLYILHHNERIGEGGAGWNAEDQLLRQLSHAKNGVPAYKGSVFNSYAGLAGNALGTTDTLASFYNNEINEESLFEDLTMLAPKSLNYSTNDAIAVFQGTYDDNFDVYFNDNKITLNEAGYFYIEKPLNVGMNYFSIKHKGKVISYGIERKVISLYSIDASIGNGKTLNVDGGTGVTVSAIAYKGAKVTATLNGETVKLTEQEANIDDAELRASYALFTGRYKVPDGIIEQVQDLGVISVTADYKGYVRTMQGASVTVNALPKPPPPPEKVNLLDQDSAGSGEVVGYMDAVRSESEAVTYVKLKNDYTLIFDAKTTGNSFDPNLCRLPAGTIDYYRSLSGNFYTTESGLRVNVDDAVLVDGYGMGENNLVVVSGGTRGGSGYFDIRLDKKASYNIRAAGVEYYTAWGDDYNVKDFNARYVYITFDNVTSVTKMPSFDSNPVFSSGKWETVTIDGFPKFRLVLELRRPGAYAGNRSYYGSGDLLTVAFPVLPGSLSGMNIVIDPGHGMKEDGHIDPGAIGQVVEQEVVLGVAKKLESRLAALGANVTRLNTESGFYLTKQRASYARQYNCDLFVSIHGNSATGNSAARGTEVWYFTPFSQPLAGAISRRVSNYFQNNVYSDGKNMDRGAKSSYFWVTTEQDFPSVLVELGFVTNYEDAMAMASEFHQEGIAAAIADGIGDYLAR